MKARSSRKMAILVLLCCVLFRYGEALTAPSIVLNSQNGLVIYDSKSTEGQKKAAFSCNATGDPLPLVTWSVNGTSVASDTGRISLMQSSGSGFVLADLTYMQVTRADHGIVIVCNASNNVSSESSNGTITVQVGVTVTLNASALTVKEGFPSNLRCDADGFPAPSITWRENGAVIPGQNSNILVISVNRTTQNYTCEAASQTATATVTALYLDKPVLLSSGGFTIREKESTVLTCNAIGSSPIMYAFKNGTTTLQTSLSNSYNLSSLMRFQDGSLTCTASNGFGSETSDNLALNVTYLDKPVLLSSGGFTIREKESTVLTCNAIGSSPIMYAFKNGTTTLQTSLSNSYNLSSLMRFQDGSLTCTASNGFGSETSDILALNVTYLDKPVLLSSGGFTIREKESTVLTCNAIGSSPIMYAFKNGTTTLQTSLSNSYNLSFLMRFQDGSLTCTASNGFGSETSDNLALNVTYLDKPVLLSSGGSTIREKESTVLTCNAIGSSPIMYAFKNGTTTLQTSLSNSYNLSSLMRFQDGSLTCTASNGFGSETSDILALSVFFPPSATANVTVMEVRLGQLVVVLCNAIGKPIPKVDWKFGNNVLATGNGMVTLRIDSAQSSDNGTYMCEASNLVADSKFQTDITVLAPPGAPSSLRVSNIMSTGLQLTWLVPSFLGNRPITTYRVEQRTEPGGSWAVSSCTAAQCIVQVTSAVITNLTAFTNYSFRVIASNEIGESVPSIVNGPILTEEDAPSPAQNLRSESRTSTSIRIAWDVPTVLNGIVEYRVFQKELEPFISAQVVVYTGAATSFDSGQLDEFTTYEYVVVAFNKKLSLNGSESNKIQVKTLSAKPSGPPLNLTVTVLSSMQLKVSWLPPSTRELNGIITSYNVVYNMSAADVFTMNTVIDRNNLTLNGLNESEVYSVRVQAINSNGTGPLTDEERAKTLEDLPSPPVNVKASPGPSRSSVDLDITWSRPLDPNGVILGYRICLQQVTNDSMTIQVPMHCVHVAGSELSYTFKGVDAYSEFNISVSANTSRGFGDKSSAAQVLSRENTPMPVINLAIGKVESRRVILQWERPRHFFGVLLNYTVQYKKRSMPSYIDFNCLSPKTVSCNVSGLDPFVDYDFQVIVVNGFGPSTPAITSQKTDIDSPPRINDNIVVKPVEGTKSHNTFEVNLTAYKFPDTNGPIQFYQVVIVRLTNSSKPSAALRDQSNLEDYSTAVRNNRNPLIYVTAEFKAEFFSRFQLFKVGDRGKSSKTMNFAKRKRRNTNSEFENVALEAEKYYTGFLRAFVNDVLFSSSPYFEPILTGKVPEEKSNTGKIVGAVIGTLIAVALVIIVAAYVVRRRRLSSDDLDSEKEIEPGPKAVKHLSEGSADPRVPVPKARFADHVNSLKANGGFGFSQEYSMIDRNLIHPFKCSAETFNNLKNRYANVPAYDHSRVVLESLDDIPGNDYINANFVEGYEDPHEYIAAQGPIPETVPDFWRMIWERNSKTIVMLTQLEEKGRTKCAKYWPDSGSITYRDIVVTSLEVLEFPDHVIRTLHLTRTGRHDERTIKQFHFIAWPDFGVPEPSPLLSLLRKVNSWRLTNPSVTVVHCSAGVGRTGSYIVIDTQLRKMRKESELNVFMNVLNIRDQRCLMVQTEDQYVFVHDAILEFIESGNTEIQASDLRDYIRSHCQVNTQTGMTGLAAEFIKLAAGEKVNKYVEANRPVNQNKNRYKNIYPFDQSRVKLSQFSGVDGSDYINANYIDGYTGKSAFIATQAPVPITIPDFWRMVWEQNCRTIVALSKEFEAGKVKIHVYWPYDKHMVVPRNRDDSSQMDLTDPRAKAYPYWPNDGAIKVEGFIIETITSSHSGDFIVRELKLTNTQFGVSRVISHFQYVSWPETGSPESGFAVIELIGHVQKWNLSAGSPPIVIHCSAGVGRTGVFIALTNLVERLKSEGVIDVFQTVKQMRRQRTAMVQTRDQYEFCYRALQEYLDSFDLYANFN